MEDYRQRNYTVHRACVRPGVEIAFIHEGLGGVPLLLLHGWPGSKRLFWRNIGPLVAAGFEIIVPDQRGFGDSPEVQGAPLTIPESATDMHALVRQLGHDRCVVAAGDFGSAVMLDLGARFPGFVIRQLIYNGTTPLMPEAYLAAGLPPGIVEDIETRSDHFRLHGMHADQLLESLDTEAKRLEYVASFFLGTHVWKEGALPIPLAGPGNFDTASARFQAEPLASAPALRASLHFYESIFGPQAAANAPPLLAGPVNTETMILWGMADAIVTSVFARHLEIACPRHFGPYFVPGAGHFLQWEAPDILHGSLRLLCRDLLATFNQPKDICMNARDAALTAANHMTAAIAKQDAELFTSIYADDVVIWHNVTRTPQTKAENTAFLAATMQQFTSMEYRDIRRVFTENGIVQQHILAATLVTGGAIEVASCLVVEMRGEQVARIDEYFDPNPKSV